MQHRSFTVRRLATYLAIAAACCCGAITALALGAADATINPLGLVPHHATIGTRDIGKEADWYVHVMGFHEDSRRQGEDFEVRHLSIPGYRIDLLWQKAASGAVHMTLPDKPGLAGLIGLGWLHVVFTAPNLASTLERLTAANADVRIERNPAGVLLRIMVRDPEHNEIEIDAEG